jgi:hypothetical protein
MSYALKLNKSKMYALMKSVNTKLSPMRKCKFSHYGFCYRMYYLHPVTGHHIRVTVETVLGDTMIRFYNETENTEYLVEHFDFSYLMEHEMFREVSE